MTMMGNATGSDGVFAVAVGCLPIVPRESWNCDEEAFFQATDKAWWKDQLDAGLGLLPSITDLVVAINGVSFAARQNADILSDFEPDYDVDYDPSPDYYSVIRFTLTIPKRMQEEIFGSQLLHVNCERFRVITIYGSRGPVTYVQAGDTTGREDKPSHLIFLVREFLIRELKRLDAPLEVKTVGPSPFWADMHLIPRSGLLADVEVNWMKNRLTYDIVDFLYDPDRIKEHSPLQVLVAHTVEPFSTYYYAVRSRGRRLTRANIVAALTDNLITVHQRRGWRGYFSKVLRSGVAARALILASITAKQLDVEERASVAERMHEAPAAEMPTIEVPELVALCEAENDETYADRLAMAQDVANALESSRISQYQVLIASGCTLLGAALGAGGTLVAAALIGH